MTSRREPRTVEAIRTLMKELVGAQRGWLHGLNTAVGFVKDILLFYNFIIYTQKMEPIMYCFRVRAK